MLPAYLRHVIRWGFASISRADWNGWLAGLTGTGLAGLARKGRDSVAELRGDRDRGKKAILITESQPTEPNLEGHNNTSAVPMPPQGVVPKSGEDIRTSRTSSQPGS